MRNVCLLLLILALAQPAASPVETQLVITSKVALQGELEDLAGFGGPKESLCDADGNIFTPSNRKYGSAIDSVLRIAPDGKSYSQFSINHLQDLEDGHVADFIVVPSGDIYALARQVL